MFQFPLFALQSYVFRLEYPAFCGMGCPIQESPGRSSLGSSPELIAAYHAFHRLLVPRHPPYALSSLTTRTFNAGYSNDEDRHQIQLSKSFSHEGWCETHIKKWIPHQLS